MASPADCAFLGAMNHLLIHDEGHRNPMTIAELEERMRGWLSGEYRAVIFEEADETVGYALFREQSDEVYLRQLFVSREHRPEVSDAGLSRFCAPTFGPNKSG